MSQQTIDLDTPDQPNQSQSKKGPVTCLGKTFDNEEARRAYFTELLREKLKDPEFRKIEGFPIGEDEDILNLSDPPYYTACPNPWIADFIAEWETEKPEQTEPYHREPFAADVSEGKNHPIYNAHSYHTKVPHRAIMRYILHYTQPGDIVFDGFCGTGMTGVAAQLCGDREEVLALGYQIQPDGTILQQEEDQNGKQVWKPFSKLGARKAVLNDLSPAATFIAYNYNTPVDVAEFEKEAKRILKEVEDECGWMYETLHTDGKTKGKINYTVWSDVFVCPDCSGEVVFWDVAMDKKLGKVHDVFKCSHCQATLTKRNMDRSWITKYDSAIKETIRQAKQVPVLINYTFNGKRAEKMADDFDYALIDKIESNEISHYYPVNRMIEGKETRRNDPFGITHAHHFYTKRNLWILAAFFRKSYSLSLKLIITGILQISSKQSSFRYDSRNPKNTAGGILKGTLYVPSLPREGSIFENYKRRLNSIISGFNSVRSSSHFQVVGTGSLEKMLLDDNSLDYGFIDPPFGSNINYSELNTTWESWLNVSTNNAPEAIENSVQNKGPNEYRQLMTACFKEAYRVLKPGRWMTVEFSNTKATVWNSIQTALTEAGFIIANVAALDKKQGSFKAVTTTTAVKQDLVISAYKPSSDFERRFEQEANTEEGVWDFIRTHLGYLAVTKLQGNLLQFIPERDPRILFDQVVAYYVRKGYPVPIDSVAFQLGLKQRFEERDGMFFLPEQIAEYDRKKMLSGGMTSNLELFVKDESSMIEWLRYTLKQKPQTFSDLNPQFMQQLGGWSKNELQLDLRELLNQNFLIYEGTGPVPEQIHAYLSTNWKDMRNLAKDDPSLVNKAKDRWYVPDPNKAGDLEKLREKSLLKEFETYKAEKKKLKVFRLEAVRAGFKKAWQDRDYQTIVDIANKIPNTVLEEDPKLLMWYDQATTRLEG